MSGGEGSIKQLLRYGRCRGQLHVDGGGTQTVVVLVVIPNLFDHDFNGIRHMGVSDDDFARFDTAGVGFHITVGDRTLENSNRVQIAFVIFANRSDSFGITLVLTKRENRAVPLRIDNTIHNIRADAVLVVVVNPHFSNNEGDHGIRVAVGDGEAVLIVASDVGGVVLDIIFTERVVVSFEICVILGQTGEDGIPLVVRQINGFNDTAQFTGEGDSVRAGCTREGQRDGVGTEAVVVKTVFPNLGDRDVDLNLTEGVGDEEARIGVAAINRSQVVVNRRLFHHGVNDGVEGEQVVELGERDAREGVLPAVGGVQGGDIVGGHTVSVKGHVDGCRTEMVLVVVVVPDLGNGDSGIHDAGVAEDG